MKTVFVYGFQGRYIGQTEYEYANPVIGAIHKCLLFLSQGSEDHQFECAQIEIKKYGFNEIENLEGNPLRIEVLNTDMYRNFAAFYESALEDGSCLVYYPNT